MTNSQRRETEQVRADGLECPRCGGHHLLADRAIHMQKLIQRTRTCHNCGKRIVTTETIKGATKP